MVSGVPGRIRDGVDKLGLLALALVADVEFGSDAYSFGKIVYRLYRCYAYYYFRTKKANHLLSPPNSHPTASPANLHV